MKQTKTFNDFWNDCCNGSYNPEIGLERQGSGYKNLLRMLQDNITPASLEETKRWEDNPTDEELTSIPDIKYLRFLHPNLRPIIINNWNYIKTLEI